MWPVSLLTRHNPVDLEVIAQGEYVLAGVFEPFAGLQCCAGLSCSHAQPEFVEILVSA